MLPTGIVPSQFLLNASQHREGILLDSSEVYLPVMASPNLENTRAYALQFTFMINSALTISWNLTASQSPEE